MNRSNRLLYLLAIAKFITPYLLQNHIYEPHRDEFLYLAEGYHLSWGFMEVPPMLSIFAWFTHHFGSGLFWIKFWPDLFGVLTFLITGKIVQSLGGKSFAIFLTFLPFVFGAYLRVFFLFQPNPPEIFFWTLMSYSFIRHLQTENKKWLYLFGVSVGLGMLSKYSVALFAVSLLAGLAVAGPRKILSNKHLYYAALISLLIFSPTLFWEYTHHFPILVHMKELQRTQLQYVNHLGFLKDQLLMNLPCLPIWLAGFFFTAFSFSGRKYRLFAWAYVFVVVLLLILRGKNYYSLGVYPVLFGFGAFYLESLTAQHPVFWRSGIVGFSLILGLLFIPISLPVLKPASLAHLYEKLGTASTGALRWEDLQNHPLPQDFADMLGWEELSRKAAAAYNSLDSSEKSQTIIFCDNYGEAGALSYYRYKYPMPEAYSDNGSFLYWMPHPLPIHNVILITDDTLEMQHPFIRDFRSAVLADRVNNPFARERGSLIIILKGADKDFNKMFSAKIEKDYLKFKH